MEVVETARESELEDRAKLYNRSDKTSISEELLVENEQRKRFLEMELDQRTWKQCLTEELSNFKCLANLSN